MFGYVKAFPPELTLREYELYRAGYCGVCRAMGRCNGRTSCAGLTWDSVFLFFVRTALTKDPFEVKRIFCLLHPFRRRQAVLSTPQIDYAARASAVLIHGKLQDDKKDERGVKKLRGPYRGGWGKICSRVTRMHRHRHSRPIRKGQGSLDRVAQGQSIRPKSPHSCRW